MDLIAHCRWNGWIINETFDVYRGEGDNISIWFYKSYIFSLYTVLFSVLYKKNRNKIFWDMNINW